LGYHIGGWGGGGEKIKRKRLECHSSELNEYSLPGLNSRKLSRSHDLGLKENREGTKGSQAGEERRNRASFPNQYKLDDWISQEGKSTSSPKGKRPAGEGGPDWGGGKRVLAQGKSMSPSRQFA